MDVRQLAYNSKLHPFYWNICKCLNMWSQQELGYCWTWKFRKVSEGEDFKFGGGLENSQYRSRELWDLTCVEHGNEFVFLEEKDYEKREIFEQRVKGVEVQVENRPVALCEDCE